jgi:Tol biopolymer transport system component
MNSHQFVPLLSGISATDATYSMDGNWVAYTAYPEHTLWRSRSDGSERMQLTYPPMEVWEPFISPDGTKVVFDSTGDHSVCVIDMNGGTPQTIPPVRGARDGRRTEALSSITGSNRMTATMGWKSRK